MLFTWLYHSFMLHLIKMALDCYVFFDNWLCWDTSLRPGNVISHQNLGQSLLLFAHRALADAEEIFKDLISYDIFLPLYIVHFPWNYTGIYTNNLVSTKVSIMAWWLMAPSHYLGHFYLRPVLAFGYCRCLRLSVCPSVLSCVNHELVRAITHHPFKLGSPNLDHRCKRPWLRSILFKGVIDLDLQS